MDQSAISDVVAAMCREVSQSPRTGSLVGLFGDDLTLADVRGITQEFQRAGIVAVPSIEEQPGAELPRVFRSLTDQYLSYSRYAPIPSGESHFVEFKSSLWFDRKLAEQRPDLAPKHLKKEYLANSVLKTVAGFLNSGGGELWIGVDDSGRAVGLEGDCSVLGFSYFDSDKYLQHLNNLIRGRFARGPVVSSQLSVRALSVDGHSVVRIQVPVSPFVAVVSFKAGDPYRLFERQGQETVEHGMESAQEVFRRWFDKW